MTEDKYKKLLSRLDRDKIDYISDNCDDLVKKIGELKNEMIIKRNDIIKNNNEKNKTTIELLDEKTISRSTLRSYIIAVIWYRDKNKIKTNKEKLLGEINKINGEERAKISKNILIGNQKKNYLEWTEVLDVYNKIKEENLKSINKHKNYVLLSCYTMMCVRRATDYALMHVKEDDKNLDTNKNYYIKNGGYFIFQIYKTSKYYKKQMIELTENHKGILNEYIEKYNITGSLFNLTAGAIKDKLVRMFKKYTNKTVSVNILRHSYISWLKDNEKLEDKKETIAWIMGHSIKAQNDYYKDKTKFNDPEESDESEETIEKIDDDKNEYAEKYKQNKIIKMINL